MGCGLGYYGKPPATENLVRFQGRLPRQSIRAWFPVRGQVSMWRIGKMPSYARKRARQVASCGAAG